MNPDPSPFPGIPHPDFSLAVPQADLQAVPPVLELAGHRACPRSLQVRPQAGIPGGPGPAPRAQRPPQRAALLPLTCQDLPNRHRTGKSGIAPRKVGDCSPEFRSPRPPLLPRIFLDSLFWCWFIPRLLVFRGCSGLQQHPRPWWGGFWEFSLRGDDPKGISRWFPALPVQGVELMSPEGAAAPTAPPCAGAGCKSQTFRGFSPLQFLAFPCRFKVVFFFSWAFSSCC